MMSIERAFVVVAASGLASLVLVAAGCGSDAPSSGVVQASTTSTTSLTTTPSEDSKRRAATAFAACMRSHGVPDFPDPRQTSEGEVISIPDDDSARFRSAMQSCRSLLPNGGVPSATERAPEREELLRFAACMRAHGVRDFPDPTFSDGSPFPPGIERSSPRFAAAKRACAGGVTAG